MEGMLNYFIPEDGDSSDHMNVVPLPRVDQLKLQHIKKSFPLPGEFHFRFKAPFEGTYVWLDVINDSEPVPDYNGLIVSKIARIQKVESSTTRPAERVENKTPVTQTKSQPAPDLIETSLPPTKREEPPTPTKSFNDDLVGLLADPLPTSPRSVPAPPTPTQTNPPTQDPFSLFVGPTASSPMCTGPQGNVGARGPMNAPQSNFGGGGPGNGFNPMGQMGPRPMGGMGISQMGQHMGVPQQGQPGQAGGSFSGLQWQGMGSQQQSQQTRQGMGMPPNNGGRQW